MISIEKPNPFRVLELPTDAVNKSIIEKGWELVELAESEELMQQYHNAIGELITHSAKRLEFELFEIPGMKYEDPEWERFIRLFKRKPVNFVSQTNEALPTQIKDFKLEAITAMILDSMPSINTGDVQETSGHSPL